MNEPALQSPKLAALAAAALLIAPAPAAPAAAQEGPAAPPAPAAARPPGPESPRMIEQRRRIEAHWIASRAGPPPPRDPPRPELGVELLPVDTRAAIAFSKELGARPEPPAPAAAQRIPVPPPPPFQVPPPACPTHLPYAGALPPMKTASVVKAFPDLAWHICVTDMGRKGLWVGPVQLRRGTSGPWMPVLYQAGLADIFVPYHLDTSFRPYDLHWTQGLSPISLQDVGAQGSRIWLSNETFPTVAYEVRDRGVGWLCKGNVYSATRRGQELVLWGVSDAGNYDNIIEFGFRDDGSMSFRTGNTGFNSPANPVEPHTHNALWYVDMDLNGSPGDSAATLTHSEPAPPAPPLTAVDPRLPFSIEGMRPWNPQQLTTLLVEDNATTAFGNRLGYEFAPLQNALTRHYGWMEDWTHNDLYVTRYNYADTVWASPVSPWHYPDEYLLPAVNGQPAQGQDLVLWVKTAAHHVPTDEDRANSDLTAVPQGMNGITLTHWSGFQAQPHNLFNANPLGGPPRCGV